MFNKILIANRGEIAVAIIRACREMGIATVAVCSTRDQDALHAQLADECICIGPAPAKDSYLNQQSILTACLLSGAQAIHPGYGFLAENAAFARLCQQCGIVFIGPRAETIEQMGDKIAARQLAVEAAVPVIPGSQGEVGSLEEALEQADLIGYPVLLKAAQGGGGRGMRQAKDSEQLSKVWPQARSEARACFDSERMYLEKLLDRPRHIEVQILSDRFGRTVHLGDRDCSLQRRSQKILEEAPAPGIEPAIRAQMAAAAVRLAQKAGYVGAGTVEFLLNSSGQFYFMEMNTRIQVEHPVSEMISRINLIQEQIRIAAGEKLELSQAQIAFSGHAIECRINAEDPLDNFRPSPGPIRQLQLPGGFGVRVDSALYQGWTVPSDYDSLLAKLIVQAPTRTEAINRARRALTELLIDGVKTNIDFHLAVLRDPDFISGNSDIGFIERRYAAFLAEIERTNEEMKNDE